MHRWARRWRGRRRFLDRERILLTVARAEFGRVGGPANNAGLVFLNPRTNRHLRGETAGHSARCGSRCSAPFSFSSLYSALRKRSHGPSSARDRSSNELSTLPDRRNARLPLTARGKKRARQGPAILGPYGSAAAYVGTSGPWLP